MSEHEWILPTSSLDSKANQASCAAAWLPSESATRRKEQWKTLRMQKSTYKQHWVFSCTDIWTFWCRLLWVHNNPESNQKDFFLACCSWRRSANTRCWWLGRNFWLHFRHGQHGLNHIVICSCGKRRESSKDEKQENKTKGNLLHQKNKYTETYTAWCWCIRNEKTTSTLRLVLVCTSKSGMDIMSLWNYHRYSPTEWKNWTELWPPSQCWLCRRLSGHALRQNLSRGLFSIWSILPKTPVWCLMHADKKKANKRGNCFWKARYINTLSTSIYSNLDGMR